MDSSLLQSRGLNPYGGLPLSTSPPQFKQTTTSGNPSSINAGRSGWFYDNSLNRRLYTATTNFPQRLPSKPPGNSQGTSIYSKVHNTNLSSGRVPATSTPALTIQSLTKPTKPTPTTKQGYSQAKSKPGASGQTLISNREFSKSVSNLRQIKIEPRNPRRHSLDGVLDEKEKRLHKEHKTKAKKSRCLIQ